jgi:zinc protease
VLAAGRASRLYRGVRERGLAMSASAYHYTPTQLGVFAVSVVGADDRIGDALAASWHHVRTLMTDGPTSDELARIRTVLRARRLRASQSMEGQASELVAWEAIGGADVGDAYWSAVDAVTADDIRRVLSTWCTDDAIAIVTHRPEGSAPLAADGSELIANWHATTQPTLAMESRPPVIALSSTLPPEFESRVGDVHVFRTASGVPVLVRRKRGAKLAQMGCFVLGGAVDEGLAESGLTSLMARTSLKGTETRSAAQIAEDAENLGGSVSISTSKELVGWTISVPNSETERAATLLADVVQSPSFPEAAVAEERSQMLNELRSRRDDMMRQPLTVARQALFGTHAYALDALGSAEVVATLSADTVRAWHGARVLNGSAVLAIVGDAEPAFLAQQVAAPFLLLQHGMRSSIAAPAPLAHAIEIVEHREKQQSAVAMLYGGPARRDPSRYAAALMTGVASGLGGRFFESLRSKQSLAYTVFVSASQLREAGMISAYIACAPERELEARAGLLAEFALLRDAPVSPAELERARTYAVGMHALRQESAAAQLGDMVDAWCAGDGLEELQEEVSALQAVTAADVQAIVQRWCDPDRRVEAIVRGTAAN